MDGLTIAQKMKIKSKLMHEVCVCVCGRALTVVSLLRRDLDFEKSDLFFRGEINVYAD